MNFTNGALAKVLVPIVLFLIAGCESCCEKPQDPILKVKLEWVSPPQTSATVHLESYLKGRIVSIDSKPFRRQEGYPCSQAAACGAPWPGTKPGQYRLSVECNGARYYYDATKDTIAVPNDSLHATIIALCMGSKDSIFMRIKPN